MKSGRIHALVFFLAALLVPLIMSSCLTNDAKDEFVLTFAIDSSKADKYDSLRLQIYNDGDSAAAAQTVVVKTPKGTRQVQVKLSDAVKADFFVVVTGFDSSGIAYRKQYNFQGHAEDKGNPPKALASALTAQDLALAVGETRAPALQWVPADSLGQKLILASEDSTVVRISGDSLKGVKPGNTHVTAETWDGGLKVRFAVAVSVVRVAQIQVDSLFLKRGETVRPAVTVLPANASNRDYAFTALDTTVVGVAGKSLKGLRPGKALVVAASVDFGTRDTFSVSVRIPVDSFAAAPLSMQVGDSLPPAVTWYPDSAGDKAYTLSPKDTAIVAARGDGLLAKAVGQTDVDVVAHDGGSKRTFQATVTARVYHPDSLRIPDVRLLVGDTVTPVLTWFPALATDKNYALASLDTATAAVAGLRVFGIALGKARFVATAEDGGLKDTFNVSVEAPRFTPDISPIMSSKCTPCHAADQVLNLQDSASLVRKGVSAQDRLTRPDSSGGKMPLPGAPNGPLAPRDLRVLLDWLGRNVVPVKSLTAVDTSVNLGDTAAPPLHWNPANASNRLYILSSLDTSIVETPAGQGMVPKALGQATLIAVGDETKAQVQFKLTVKAPDFARNVLPIVSFKCAPCHAPNQTFNWQDSAALLADGAESIDRLTRPDSATGKMPLLGAPNGNLKPQELRVLLGWLRAKVVPLKGITVPDDSVRVTESKAPAIAWDPVNATGRLYSLRSSDTNIVVVRGAMFMGKAVGTSQVEVDTREGNLTKTFNVKVNPIPVDSISAPDTGGSIGDTVKPRVIFHPANATNRGYTLAAVTAAHTALDTLKVVALGAGKDTLEATSLDGSRKARFVFTVAPIRPQSFTVRDTNGIIDQLVTPTLAWTPPNTTDKTYVLKIAPSDTGIAVAVGPQVKGRSVGNVNVTVVSAADTGKVAVFKFTVGPVPVASLSATAAAVGVGSKIGAAGHIVWSPANATDKRISLTADTGFFAVAGDSLTGKKTTAGSTVTITSTDGNHQASWSVAVVHSPFATSTAKGVLDNRCIACHFTGNGSGLNSWQDSGLVATQRLLIEDRVTKPDSLGGRMPPSPAARLTQNEVDSLMNWLNQ